MDLPESLRERAGRAAQEWAPGAQVTNVVPLTGGASSLTFVAEILGAPPGHSRVVLKVAPPGLPPVRNRDVLRQGRLMAALYGRPGVPVPLSSSRTQGRRRTARLVIVRLVTVRTRGRHRSSRWA